MQMINHKKLIATALLLVTSVVLKAQEVTDVGELSFMEKHSGEVYFLVSMIALLLILGVVLGLTHFLMTEVYSLRRELLRKQGIEVSEEEEDFIESLITKISTSLQDSVPIEEEEAITFDHEYDGIRELDNSLPPWWTMMFYISIVFAFVYVGWFHVFEKGDLQIAEYKEEMRVAAIQHQEYLDKQANLVNESNVTALTDAGSLAQGLDIFITNCATCHGEKGEGTNAAPNLTDMYWIHGGGIKNVFSTIKYGVVDKGMRAWGKEMSGSDLHKVASYVMSLKGSAPPNPKAPEGELWEESDEVPESAPADSTAIPDSVLQEVETSVSMSLEH